MGAGPAGLARAIELARLARSDAETGDELGEVEVSVVEARWPPVCVSECVGWERELMPRVSIIFARLASGLARGGESGVDLTARVTALAEGVRGLLAKDWLAWQRAGSRTRGYARSTKELRKVKWPLERKVHNTVRNLACLLSNSTCVCESTD